MFNYVNTRAVCPLFELFNGGGAKSVGCGEYDLFALLFIHGGKLAYRGGLAHAVDAYHKYNCGHGDKIHLLTALKKLRNDIFYRRFNFIGLLQMLFCHTLTELFGYLHSCFDAHIAHYKNLFKLLIKLIIDLGLAVEHRVDGDGHVLSRFFQALVNAFKKPHINAPSV